MIIYEYEYLIFTFILLLAYVLISVLVNTFNMYRHDKNVSQHITTGILWVMMMNMLYMFTNMKESNLFMNKIYLSLLILTPIILGLLLTHIKELRFNSKNILDTSIGRIVLGVCTVLLLLLIGLTMYKNDNVQANAIYLILSSLLILSMHHYGAESFHLHHYILFAFIALQATNNSVPSAILGGLSSGMLLHGLASYQATSFYDDPGKVHIFVRE